MNYFPKVSRKKFIRFSTVHFVVAYIGRQVLPNSFFWRYRYLYYLDAQYCSGHLLYWGKATVIYPICESNLYVLSPHLPVPLPSQLSARHTPANALKINKNQQVGRQVPTSLSVQKLVQPYFFRSDPIKYLPSRIWIRN